tara:strand:+ start:4857 stop:5330 length:474 start_codon:yes stop_codon:yes gene_type:complete
MDASLKTLMETPSVPESQISRQAQAIFIKALQISPANIAKACREAKVSRSKVFAQRQIDPFFAEMWAECVETKLDELEEKQFETSVQDTNARQWTLARARRQKWGDKQLIEVGGEVEHVHSVREIPTDKLEALIRKRMQEGDAPKRLDPLEVESEVV